MNNLTSFNWNICNKNSFFDLNFENCPLWTFQNCKNIKNESEVVKLLVLNISNKKISYQSCPPLHQPNVATQNCRTLSHQQFFKLFLVSGKIRERFFQNQTEKGPNCVSTANVWRKRWINVETLLFLFPFISNENSIVEKRKRVKIFLFPFFFLECKSIVH